MDTALLFYTNNLLPAPLLREAMVRMASAAQEHGCLQITSSHFPITSCFEDVSDDEFLAPCREDIFNFDSCISEAYVQNPIDLQTDVAVVTGRLKYSPETIARQIVHALRRTDVDKVLLMEHDVFYPDDYVPMMSAALDEAEFALYDNYVFMDPDGFFGTDMEFFHLSRYGARRTALIDFFTSKIEEQRFAILEPVFMEHFSGDSDSDLVKGVVVGGEVSVLDIKHGANAAGQILVGEHKLMDDHWGFHPKYLPLFEDPAYDAFLGTDATLGYGLFRGGVL